MLVRSGSHVAIADRERHAYNVGVATCFWCIFFWKTLKQRSHAVLKIQPPRIEFQDLKDCECQQDARVQDGGQPRIAVDAARDESIAPRRPMWSSPVLLRRTSTITVA
jgi:hypothetical protein